VTPELVLAVLGLTFLVNWLAQDWADRRAHRQELPPVQQRPDLPEPSWTTQDRIRARELRARIARRR
jgi:hypothetical protein